MKRKEIREYLKSTGILYCGGYGDAEFHMPGSNMMFCMLLPKGVYFFRLNGLHLYNIVCAYDKINVECLDCHLRRYTMEVKIKKQRNKLKELEADFDN